MNWILLVVLAVLILSIWHGYRKGLLRMIYSLVSGIVILILVIWATPYINTFLLENTSIYQTIEENCANRVRQSAEKTLEDGSENMLNQGESDMAKLGVNLPNGVLDDIMERTTGAADEFLESSGVYDEIAGEVAGFALNGIAFFAAVIVVSLLMHIISRVLGIVSKIPILSGMNRTLGLFAGGVYGLILVWIAFYIIALCSTSETGKVLITYIYESPLLKFLYENNMVLTLIMHYL